MRDYEMFIGADNETGLVDVEAVKAILGEYFKGWTMTSATGAWDWQEEPTVVVLVHDSESPDPDSVRDKVLEALRSELRQEAIGWRAAPPMTFHYGPATV